jgi:predicted dehydrogenase
MKKLKVGVVGAGHLGNYHLQKYQNIDHVEIVGVVDVLEQRAQQRAETFQCQAYTDHHALLGTVDAVSIAVPTKFHHIITKDFLEAGIDVLLEKPITETLVQADELVSIAGKKQLIFQVGFVERFNPAVVALGKVMEKPLFIEAHRLHPFFERGTDVDVILDLMIHDLDIILEFVASPVKTVEAVGVSVLSNKVDIANAHVTFESGCVANITASRVTGKTLQKIRFFGMEGYHAVDFGKRELLSLRRKNINDTVEIVENKIDIDMHDPLEQEIRSFVHAVITRTPPLVSGQDGRRSLELGLVIVEKMKLAQEAIR